LQTSADSLSHWYYPASPHRRFWNWVEYIFFLYNAIVGIIASIFRILLSVGVNLLLLFRLDTVILMKGWEFLDVGMSNSSHISTSLTM